MEYDQLARFELLQWQQKMQKKPTLINKISKRVQYKINSYIPEKVHRTITTVIKQMVRGILFGSELTANKPLADGSLYLRELLVKERISFYKKTAASEGAITGAGGILLGLADFPLLLAIKIKFLYELAALFGFDLKDYKERVYLLYIFQLAFSSQEKRNEVYKHIENWEEQAKKLGNSIDDFDWRSFQQEYRDYIDIAKMAQLVPVIGAAVGAVVNYQLIDKLGETAINAYRLRLLRADKIK